MAGVRARRTGCGGNQGPAGSASSNQGQITVWLKKQLTEVSNEMVLERCRQFEAEKGVKVNAEILAFEDFYYKWTAAIESGNVPEVTFINDVTARQFYDADVLADVEDLYQKINSKLPVYQSLAGHER